MIFRKNKFAYIECGFIPLRRGPFWLEPAYPLIFGREAVPAHLPFPRFIVLQLPTERVF
jgi:hypothetical protein